MFHSLFQDKTGKDDDSIISHHSLNIADQTKVSRYLTLANALLLLVRIEAADIIHSIINLIKHY